MPAAGPDESSPVVDFSAHLHPTPLGGSGFQEFIEDQIGGPAHRVPERAADLFDRAGIDYSVLSQSNYMGHDDVDETRRANDELLEIVSDFERYYGLAALPVAAGGEAAAEEFERCLASGYHGGAVETASGGYELVDDELEPVLEVADAHGVPLLVHPVIDDSLHPDALDDHWYLNAIWGREVALCESLFKVINEGVLDEYPDLHLVYHHSGGGIGSMMGRIRLYLEPGRRPGHDHLLTFREFKRVLEERIYVDLSGHFGDSGVFQKTIQEFSPSKLLFGTDFPYETRKPDTFKRLIRSVRQSTSHRGAEKILGGNAIDLLEGDS